MDDFWKIWTQSNWPNDFDPAYVFLGRAVLQYGSVCHGFAWTDSDPSAYFDAEKRKQLPATHSAADFYDLKRAGRLLEVQRPDFRRSSQALDRSPNLKFTDEQWAAARDIYQATWAETSRASKRMEDVIRFLAQGFAAGNVKFGLRPKIGGSITEGRPSWWMTEQLKPRFRWCQMNPRDPFSNGIGGDGFCYIYVERGSLNALCRSSTIETTQKVKEGVFIFQPITHPEVQVQTRDSDQSVRLSGEIDNVAAMQPMQSGEALVATDPVKTLDNLIIRAASMGIGRLGIEESKDLLMLAHKKLGRTRSRAIARSYVASGAIKSEKGQATKKIINRNKLLEELRQKIQSA